MKHTKVITGYVTFNKNDDYSDVEKIGGYLDVRGADTKAAFPVLVLQNCGSAMADKLINAAFARNGFALFDGLLSFTQNTKILKTGAKIHRIVLVGKTKASFCIETSNGVFSHGDTIKQAKDSLIYKIGDRDKSAYNKWTLKTIITKQQAIESYRVITGACELGTKNFVESVIKPKAKYAVAEVVALTTGQYKHDSYKAFFKV